MSQHCTRWRLLGVSEGGGLLRTVGSAEGEAAKAEGAKVPAWHALNPWSGPDGWALAYLWKMADTSERNSFWLGLSVAIDRQNWGSENSTQARCGICCYAQFVLVLYRSYIFMWYFVEDRTVEENWAKVAKKLLWLTASASFVYNE